MTSRKNRRTRQTAAIAAFAFSILWASAKPQNSAQTPTPEAPPAPSPNFFVRWADFYKQDWRPDPNAPPSPAPARRGLPSPLDAPPFPSSDWSYGGSPTIGEPDTNSYPLMTAINEARSRFKLYGWLDPTLNFSTSSSRNAPEGNDLYSNRFELNQAVLYAERLPDTVQRDHIDWGFHLTALYGTDYRYTTNKGYFSDQLIVHNRQYGFDPALEYVDIYFPHVAQGMNLRIGRYISIPGIEAQLSPNNYFFSHSLLYVIDPFTDTGALATIKLYDQWLIQLGITASHDVALWTPDAKPSGTACVSYTTHSVNDNIYALRQRHQRWQIRLQQPPAVRHHLVPQVLKNPPHGHRNLVHVRARRPFRLRPHRPRTRHQRRLVPPRRTPLHRPRVRRRQLSQHRALPPRLHRPPQRSPRRQKGPAHRLPEPLLRKHHQLEPLVRRHRPAPPRIRFDHAWDRPAYNNGTHIQPIHRRQRSHLPLLIPHLLIPPLGYNHEAMNIAAMFPSLTKMFHLSQRYPASRSLDIGAILREGFDRKSLGPEIHPGMRVAVGVGSRGITNLAQIVRSVIDLLREYGAEPFIIPTMGSHGGATPSGQQNILAGYGVTPESTGVSFETSMDVDPIGAFGDSYPIVFSRAALQADAIVIINRIKPHTDFFGKLGSGIQKMLVIGFGKHVGAANAHRAASQIGHEAAIRESAQVILSKVPVLFAVAILEDQHHQTHDLQIIRGDEILEKEDALFLQSQQLLPRLPFSDIDLLIVDELGKEISGSGMDTNVIGRGVFGYISSLRPQGSHGDSHQQNLRSRFDSCDKWQRHRNRSGGFHHDPRRQRY